MPFPIRILLTGMVAAVVALVATAPGDPLLSRTPTQRQAAAAAIVYIFGSAVVALLWLIWS